MKLFGDKDVKRRLETFLLFDYRGVEKHLSKMAQNGWKLEEVGRYSWKYRRIEPADLKYAVTYVPDASDLNPEPTDNQLTLEEYCAEAGWEKIGDWEQMQIFCSAEENPIPIETDEKMRLDVIKKSMKKSFLPGQIAVLVLMFLLLAQQVNLSDPVKFFAQNYKLLLVAFMVYVTIANLANLFSYFNWCRRSEKAVAEGGTCAESPNYQTIQKVTLVLTVLFLIVFMVTFLQANGNGAGLFMVLYLTQFTIMCAVVELMRQWLKKAGVSKTANWIITILVVTVLTFLMITAVVVASLQYDWLSDEPVAVYTTEDGREYEIYRDELPLTVQDLLDAYHPNYSYKADGSSSPLMAHYEYRQHLWHTLGEAKMPTLEYEITDVKVEALYAFCLNDYLEQDESAKRILGDDVCYRPVDAEPWGADAVYQYFHGNLYVNEWILCKDNRIVLLNADWLLDENQMAIAGQKLLCTEQAE
ncbi:MAG: DUF2812 domain-containing protein [Peptococcaceae bacterium]|nr:DUF2812 domain-containing protein [Peptococcaceae bacterium]